MSRLISGNSGSRLVSQQSTLTIVARNSHVSGISVGGVDVVPSVPWQRVLGRLCVYGLVVVFCLGAWYGLYQVCRAVFTGS